jgi:phosphatidylglycerol:prolipoprotein diacylglycerol transferase
MLFYDLYDFLANPLIIFQVHEGGMASHGGFLGVILAAVIFARRNQVSFLKLTDILATITPPGLMFGRIANFINGELWGRPATVPWAVIFPESAPEGMAAVPRHPSQLYQAGLEGLSLLILVQIRFWTSRGRLPAGQLSGEFLIAYACFRIFAELFREPDLGDPMILGMSRGQFLSIFMIAVGAVVIVWARVRSQARV